MVKFTGWAMIILCSIFLLIFGSALLVMILALRANPAIDLTDIRMIVPAAGYVGIILLLVLGLRNGIKKVRKEKEIEILDYEGRLDIKLSGKISYRNYRNFILSLSLKKPVYLIFAAIAILWIIAFIADPESFTDTGFMVFIFPGIILLAPVLTLRQIQSSYKNNKIFHENLSYHLSNHGIHIKGDTMDSNLKWERFFKVKESRDFILLYQDKILATILEKELFKENELIEFRKFIKSLNVKREIY